MLTFHLALINSRSNESVSLYLKSIMYQQLAAELKVSSNISYFNFGATYILTHMCRSYCVCVFVCVCPCVYVWPRAHIVLIG